MNLKITSDDFGKVGHALGVVNGIAKEYESGYYVADMVKAATTYAADKMGDRLDDYQKANGKIGHVYEWRMQGVEPGRLFDIYRKGNGRNQVVTWNFRASKTKVPTLEEREKAGQILPVPEKIKSRMGNRGYVFTQKAMLMEYGATVTIKPKGDKQLFIPLNYEWTDTRGRKYSYVFTKKPVSISFTKNSGQFAMAWKAVGPHVTKETLTFLEKEIAKSEKETGMRMGKTGTKNFQLGYSQGENLAKNRMKMSGDLINIIATQRKYA